MTHPLLKKIDILSLNNIDDVYNKLNELQCFVIKKHNNLLLVKYENLLANPKLEFIKIIDYLEKLLKINFNEKKIKNAINSTSFYTLKKKEINEGFYESVRDKLGDGKKRFFNLGPENNWEKLVDKNIVNEIEKQFETEMKELNYL